MMQRRLYQTLSLADSWQAAFQAKPRGPSPPPRTSLFKCLKQSWGFNEILYSGVSWKTEKKTLLLKRNKGWHFPQEFHVLRVLYMTGRFWRHGPDQKTNNCTKRSKTFTSSSSSCWIPRRWSKLKSQSLACVKRGWFYRKATTRTLLLCLIFSCLQKLGTSWLATFADEVVGVWFPVLFTFSWQCSVLQDQEDRL